MPLHLWLPLAHPASAVLSGAMIKAGLLGWMQVLPLNESGWHAFGVGWLVLSIASAWLGAILGAMQSDPKAVLAYPSISQMGIISVGIGAAMIEPGLWPAIAPMVAVYALHHGLAKGALFLGVGVAQLGAPHRWQRWAITAVIAIPALTLAGLPLTSGAAAKNALKAPLADLPAGTETLLTWGLLLAAVGTTAVMARFLWLTRPATADVETDRGRVIGMISPWLTLILCSLGSAWLVAEGFGMKSVYALHLTPAYLWQGVWPIALGIGLAVIAWWANRRGAVWTRIAVPAGDLLALLEPAIAKLVARVRGIALPTFRKQEKRTEELGEKLSLYRIVSGRFDVLEQAVRRFQTAGIGLLVVLLGMLLAVWRW